MNKHKDCKHYNNGICKITNGEVPDEGPACGYFE